MVVGDLATNVDVLVLGAGPGGYSAAVRAAQLGQEVVLVDSGALGGGWRQSCIPAKALANAAGYLRQISQLAQSGITTEASFDWAQIQAWKNSQVEQMMGEIKDQLDQYQVELVPGRGWFLGENEARIEAEYGAKRYLFDHAIIAIGCSPTPWPDLPFDGVRILTPTQVLALTELPLSLNIIGADYIAAGLAAIFAKLGVAVDLLLPAGQHLLPEFDPAAGQVIQMRLQELGVQITDLADLEDLPGLIIVSGGLTPRTEGLALDQARVKVDPTSGFIEVNDRQRTSNPTIYAVGDVTGAPPLAHVAIKQGQVAADNIAGRVAQFAPQAIPRVTWTDPPVAAAGLSMAEAEAAGYQVKRFRLNVEPLTSHLQPPGGFIEVVAEQDSDIFLGLTIVSPEAEGLIGEAALALEMGATLTDLAETLHPGLGAGAALVKAAEIAISNFPAQIKL